MVRNSRPKRFSAATVRLKLFCMLIVVTALISVLYAEDIQAVLLQAKQGDAAAQTHLGFLYYKGDGVPQNFREALKWFQSAAGQQYPGAEYDVGVMYDLGAGVAESKTEAATWYRRAADHGQVEAQIRLALLYANGDLPENPAEATKWYRKVAEQGHAESQFNLAEAYRIGQGVPKSSEEAAKWYRKAAEQGYGRAQGNLGFLYYNGDGVPQSYQQALKWFQSAADQQLARAQYDVGVMYDLGAGVAENKTEAAKWYRKAAKQRYAEAEFRLAEAYRTGEGVPRDSGEAAIWYERAAKQRHPQAQFNLAEAYTSGEGVLKSPKEAMKWYRKAAEQGHPEAQFKLADALTGEEAVGWYRKAAEQGHAEAQSRLGNIYVFGAWVDQNPEEGLRWLRKAAEQGAVTAALSLAEVYEVGLGVPTNYQEAYFWYLVLNDDLGELLAGETVKEKLSPAELAAVQQRLAEWKVDSEASVSVTYPQERKNILPSSSQPPSQNSAPPTGVQFIKKFDTNTGELFMSLMANVGKDKQYFTDNADDEIAFPSHDDFKKQVDYFSHEREYKVFVEFGGMPYQQRDRTTNCVNLELETTFMLIGGKDGSVNGKKVSDPSFKDFAKGVLGVGVPEGHEAAEWANAFVVAHMGEQISDMQKLQRGNLVHLGGHTGAVGVLIRNEKGVLTDVILFDANLPLKGEDFKTRSAIHEDRKISIRAIKRAIRLYDVKERPWLGLQVEDLNPPWFLANHPGLPEPNGVLVKQVSPGSPAERAGIRPGDIITEYNGRPIDALELIRLTFQTIPGKEVPIKVLRQGKEEHLVATLGLAVESGTSADLQQQPGVGWKELAQQGQSQQAQRTPAANAGAANTAAANEAAKARSEAENAGTATRSAAASAARVDAERVARTATWIATLNNPIAARTAATNIPAQTAATNRAAQAAAANTARAAEDIAQRTRLPAQSEYSRIPVDTPKVTPIQPTHITVTFGPISTSTGQRGTDTWKTTGPLRH